MSTLAPRSVALDAAPARFRDQLAAERIKILSLRSTYALAAAAIGISLAAALFLSSKVHLSAYGKASYDPLVDEFNTGTWGALMTAAACVGAIAATGEFHSGLIRTTAVAVPGRVRTLLAKAAALAALAGVVGVTVEAATYTVSRIELAHEGINTSLGTATLIKALVATALALPVSAILGLAFGTVLRHPAVAPLTAVVVLAVLPSFIRAGGRGFQAMLDNAMLYHAWCALVGQPANGGVRLQQPPSVTLSWFWLGAWPCLAMLIAALVHRQRDL
jgi:ABC-2 type transport system permease protein